MDPLLGALLRYIYIYIFIFMCVYVYPKKKVQGLDEALFGAYLGMGVV